MKTPPLKIILAGVLALLLIGVFYMTKGRPLSVEIAKIEKNVEVKVFGLGTVEARVLSKIGFKVSNTIVKLNVDEGDLVKKGDVLARLDSAEQQARLAKAKAGVLSAKSAQKGAEATILKAKVVFAQKKRTNNRKQALYKRRTVSAEMAETAKLDRDTAKAELDIANSALLSANAALATAKAQLQLEEVALEQRDLRAPYRGIITTRRLNLGTVIKASEP